MGWLKFANVPVKALIYDPDVYGFLDGPCDVLHLPAHYGEIVHTYIIPRG